MTSTPRAAHAKVKAYYALVAHQLTDEQRRVMRTYLARLASMAQAQERAQWERLQVAPINQAPFHQQVRAGMAQARLTALSIADVIAPAPQAEVVRSETTSQTLGFTGEGLEQYATRVKEEMDHILQQCKNEARIAALKESLQQS